MTETNTETIMRRLSGRRVGLDDAKARRYVGQFLNRRRIGGKIIADVEGNQGTYTVSLDAQAEEPVGACSCYIGAGGGCHHVRALAQTFLDAPGSFTPRETRTRRQLRTLDDLATYLETVSLESLLSDLQARDLARKRVSQVLGASKHTLAEAAEQEMRNAPAETAGALKLACLYLLEWTEAAARDDDLARVLSGRGRRELVDLIGELLGQLGPVARRQFLDRLGPVPQSPAGAAAPDAGQFLAEIDRLALDCEKGVYYDHQQVDQYHDEDYGDSFEPDLEVLDVLDGLLGRAGVYHQAGDHAVAVAAYEKLFDVMWGETEEWFGFDEISDWLKTDLKEAMGRYLASLGRILPPEEYAQRAWERVGWVDHELLVEASAPEQWPALEAHLLKEMEKETAEAPAGPVPGSLGLLRLLYERQGRTEDHLALCRRWRRRYPSLFTPLMDHAEQIGDWAQLEALAGEALSMEKGRAAGVWTVGDPRSELEQRLSRALERQGDLEGALNHALSAFRTQSHQEGYRRVSDLAGRISGERRAGAVQEMVDFLHQGVLAEGTSPYGYFSSSHAELLAGILLAEGRHPEAYDLAMATRGGAQARLLTIVGNFYLAGGWGEKPAAGSEVERALAQSGPDFAFWQPSPAGAAGAVAREEALSRAAECYRGLVQIHVDARGRDSYATAAGYAAVMRQIYSRLGRRADFDQWYAGMMDSYRRFRALREEFRRQLGPEPPLGGRT